MVHCAACCALALRTLHGRLVSKYSIAVVWLIATALFLLLLLLLAPQLLSYPGVNPAVVLANGGNLLHAAVDLLDADVPACTASHFAVLIDAVRMRLKPADFLVDPVSGRMPLDLQFIDHCSPDGITALYKVRGTHLICCQGLDSAPQLLLTPDRCRRQNHPNMRLLDVCACVLVCTQLCVLLDMCDVTCRAMTRCAMLCAMLLSHAAGDCSLQSSGA